MVICRLKAGYIEQKVNRTPERLWSIPAFSVLYKE
jgi:hypothetical protein